MSKKRKIRYAVIGLGHIAQKAVLPAFSQANENSELAALVSSDSDKLEVLSRRYKVKNCYSYSEYAACLDSGKIDAVYIATPNTRHHYFAEMAARRGVHVLCEKPMATDERTCISMIESASENNIKLMIAYRLHFDPANLRAIEVARSNQIGELRIFNSIFTMQIQDRSNIRLKHDLGGGPLFDIGIYCINASRYLFNSEPMEVMAMSANNGDRRFREVDEMTGGIIRYPGNRLATFITSFGAASSSSYSLIGTEGSIQLENAYSYNEPMKFQKKIEKNIFKKKFAVHDQFASELLYFSNCIINNIEPEPSGWEGLADIKIIRALLKSAQTGVAIKIDSIQKTTKPSPMQEIIRARASNHYPLVHVSSPREKNVS